MKLVAATSNEHKLKEMREILQGIELLSLKEIGFCAEIEETGSTFCENALLKARAVMKASGLAALADDSGLCVDALNGAPGILSARYSGGGSAQNRALLLRNLQGVTNRRAHFVCCVALVFPDGREITAEGKSFGRILDQEFGKGGFGYDPLFFSDDLQCSFAEASEKEKNAVSHRGRALLELKKKMESQAFLQ